MEMVRVFCENNKQYKDYPAGITLQQILDDQNIAQKQDMVLALVNNEQKSLSHTIYRPKNVEFLTYISLFGRQVYVRTLSLIMAKAVYELFPNSVLHIEYPVAKGYFCHISNFSKDEVSTFDILNIKTRMLEIIHRDLPIEIYEKETQEVISLFEKYGHKDKSLLLKTQRICYAKYCELDGYVDGFHGPILPSTGKIHTFDLRKYDYGILLQLPSKENPHAVDAFIDQPKMCEIFKENVRLNAIIGVGNIGELNTVVDQKQSFNLIKLAEALHEKKIVHIADKIVENIRNIRFVLISGPSSSGKTTFSKRLSVQLAAAGIRPITISLDDYFVDRENTPKDENGNLDFESLYAMDIPFFNKQLNQLLSGEEIELPSFDFTEGKRLFKGNKIQLKPNNIVIMEGIHALNPELTAAIPNETKFKVYVSALTTIAIDNHNWISTTENRLLRRIVRDYKYRGYSAEDTINRWESVRKGEDKWIFPYQENADVMFNSALIFEFAVLKKYVEQILSEVPKNSKAYSYAHRLQKFLCLFRGISEDEIPSSSLFREFIGGSSFRY